MHPTVERFADEPIIIVTYEGQVEVNDVIESSKKVTSMILEKPVNTALIFDTTNAQANFAEIMGILRKQVMDGPQDAPPIPLTVILAFVGTSPMIRLYVDVARQPQYGGQNIPLFPTLDDAIHAMRVALTEQKLAQ